MGTRGRWAAIGLGLLVLPCSVALVIAITRRPVSSPPPSASAPIAIVEGAPNPVIRTSRAAPARRPPARLRAPSARSVAQRQAAPSRVLGSWSEILETWAHEANDKESTENMVGYMNSVLASADASTGLLEDIECKQTLCRIVLRNKGGAETANIRDLVESDRTPFRFGVELNGNESRVIAFVPRTDVSQSLFGDAGR